MATIQVFAQAQAYIGHFQYAQAQAQISLWVRPAQAQARIKQTYQTFSQAQVQIGRGWGWAQAQVQISTTDQYGQASVDILQTYPLPFDPGTYTIRPNADDAQSGTILYSSGTTGWNLVDEVVLNQADYYNPNAVGSYLFNGFEISSTLVGYDVRSVVIHVVASNPAPAQNGLIQVRNPATGTRYTQLSFGQNMVIQEYTATMTTRPWDSQPWTRADVEQIQVGGAAGGANGGFQKLRVMQLWLTVDYYWDGTFAQAQARIKVTDTVSAQAQAYIGSLKSAQANASILATSTNYSNPYGQAQALISMWLRPAQAQARIKTTYRVFAQAQTQLNLWIQPAQAQAFIVGVTSQYAQAQAYMVGTIPQPAQALALIVVTGIDGFGQAQADIEATYSRFAQALSKIRVGGAYIVQGAYQSFGGGLGAADLVFTNTVTANNLLVMAQSAGDWFGSNSLDLNPSSKTFTSWGTVYNNASHPGTLAYRISTGDEQTLHFNGTAGSKNEVYIWEVANAGDPTTFEIVSATLQSASTNKILSDFTLPGALQFMLFTWAAAADGQTVGEGWTQDYQDWGASNGSLGAHAENGTTPQISGTSYAWAGIAVGVTSNAKFQYAQAQAHILPVNNAFAQSQADILATSNGFSQSQADILQIYNQYAQAQTKISSGLETYDVYAQVQADILTTYNGFAQAQVTILGWAFGQAQTSILQVYNAFAQAQADILAVSFGFSQAQATIVYTYFVIAQAQTSILIVAYGFAQAQSTIVGWAFAQAQSDIVQTYFSFAQAQASIILPATIEYVFAQAQSWVCWTDTFTRTTSVGMGTGWTWADIDSTFGPDGSTSTYHVDGSKLIDSPDNFDADTYTLNNPVPLDGTISFEFTTTTSVTGGNWPFVGLDFGTGYIYGSQINLYVWADATDTWFIGDWYAQSFSKAVTIQASKTYVIKASYRSDGRIAYKLWDKTLSEPDWMVFGDLSTIAGFTAVPNLFIDIEFYQAIASVDNIQICIPSSVVALASAQAAAQITTTTPNAQAAAQITTTTPNAAVQTYVNWETAQLPFWDSFTRTTNHGLGSPVYKWTNPATSLHVDGSTIILPVGVSDSYTLQTTPFDINQIWFDLTFTTPTEPFTFNLTVPGTDTLLLNTHYTAGGFTVDFYRNGVFIINKPYTSVVSGTTYTVKLVRAGSGFFIQIWQGNTLLTQISFGFSLVINGATNVILDFVGGATNEIKIDNLVILSNGVVFGYAQAKIAAPVTTRKFAQAKTKIIIKRSGFAQAQADIKAVITQYGQAQAILNTGFALGQAQALIIAPTTYGFAQAQTLLNTGFGLAETQVWILQNNNIFGQALALILTTKRFVGQSKVWIKSYWWGWAQVQVFILPRLQIAQAQTYITNSTGFSNGQTQTRIKQTYIGLAQSQTLLGFKMVTGQSQALVTSAIKPVFGQSLSKILRKPKSSGNAQVLIKVISLYYAQAQAQIVGYLSASGNAQCLVDRPVRFAQAQCIVYQTVAGNLVRYNKYQLPGYLQREVLASSETLYLGNLTNFEEYLHRENKQIEISMLVMDQTYQAAKEQVTTAASMLWSNRTGYSELILIHPERYYLAKTQAVKLEQTAGARERAAEYEVTFDCLPWSFGQTHYMVGTDTNEVGRTIRNGTWTPAKITLTGTDITVSGYTPNGEFTGFISISGYVQNLTLDHENLINTVTNGDYQLFVAPGRTLFAISGATSYVIEWQDRWEI